MIVAIIIVVLAIAGYLYVRSHKAQVATEVQTLKADVRTDISGALARINVLEAKLRSVPAAAAPPPKR